MPLVDYPSDSTSSHDSDSDTESNHAEPVAKRRRVLPSLPGAFDPEHKDDPVAHQGRTRSRPYVDGEYNAHLYISLRVGKPLHAAIDGILDRTRSLCPGLPALHSFLSPPPGQRQPQPLHISLTHPLPLRRSQIKAFQEALASRLRRYDLGAGHSSGLRISLAGETKVYMNGRRYGGEGAGGRAFLALRVGAGATVIERLVETVIHPILDKHHLPLYHANPEFHASYAWCLLPVCGQQQSSVGGLSSSDRTPKEREDLPTLSSGPTNISPIGEDVLRKVNEAFAPQILAAQPQGGWIVDGIELKIGKEVMTLPLSA